MNHQLNYLNNLIMKERIQIICLILITLSIVISAAFFVWNVWEGQMHFQRQEQEKTLKEIWME